MASRFSSFAKASNGKNLNPEPIRAMAIQVFIKERSRQGEKFTPTVPFDALGESEPLTVENPASKEQERELERYFEEWLNFPFTDKARTEQAAEIIREYGEELLAQVFRSDPDIYVGYQRAMGSGAYCS